MFRRLFAIALILAFAAQFLAAKGVLGEQAAATTMTRAGYTGLDARLARNNGFDGVWVKRNPDGAISDIIITESKYSSTGTAYLPKTATMGRQLSPQWINANIQKMLLSSDRQVQETGELLQQNQWMIRVKGNVLDSQGVNRWNIFK